MNRFVTAILIGFTIVATVSTSASAFQCLARSSNGVAVWGYGIFFTGPRILPCVIVVVPVESTVISPSVAKAE
jgi:hypothetical protein